MRFPPPPSKICSNFGDRRKGGFGLPSELFFDREEVVADEIKNLFSRKQRDGKSPDLTLVLETWGRESCRPGKAEEAPEILGGAAATSSGDKFLTLASVRATSAT